MAEQSSNISYDLGILNVIDSNILGETL